MIEYDLERTLNSNNRMRITVDENEYELCNVKLGSQYWLKWCALESREMIRFLLYKLVKRKVEIMIYKLIENDNESKNFNTNYITQMWHGKKVYYHQNEKNLLTFLGYFYPSIQLSELD